MSLRSSWMLLVILSLAASIHGQAGGSSDPSGNTVESGGQGDGSMGSMVPTVTTNGIFGAVKPYFRPVTTLLYQVIDSVLRNVFKQSLPCDIYDFTRMEIKCTPLQ